MASESDFFSDSDSDSDGDFGYDLSLEDENLLATLADSAHAAQHQPEAITPAARPVDTTAAPRSSPALGSNDIPSSSSGSQKRKTTALVGLARIGSVDAFVRKTQPQPIPSVNPTDDIQYPDLTEALDSLEQQAQASGRPQVPVEPTKSPLSRFRTFPRKPLSVSDLTAGAWCEIQYEYTLTRLPRGKKIRTTAMKEGSKVHQKLEDEVHTTVKVDIATKEDAFGLKVWNIIQGLRTLRDTGLTRELEVWGLVDGNVVNGLIDFLSYENPSPEFEEEWLSSQGSQAGPEDESQHKITTFFQSDRPQEPRPKDIRKVYLTDVKTRSAKNVPKGAAIRPTKVQLYLYHRFLSDMAADKLDYLQVFNRYGLDVDKPFSNAFLAQIGELHDDVFHDTSSVMTWDTISSQQSDTHDLLRYRTLRELIPLLRNELKSTFPAGGESIGCVVTVEYRLRGDEGALIGTNVLAVDTEVLDQYLGGYMQWWRGERPAIGVDVEEAYKCSSCDFAEICTWREEIDRENLRRAREKTAARAAAGKLGNRSKSPSTRRRKTASPT